ncbi:hypothetical protein VDGD_00567 [Verticillium dahliae]|nr:hypothetical protein VDGD_00567 [Verticillium dahliae]
MLSLASLLNPSPQGSSPAPSTTRLPQFMPSPTASSPATSTADDTSPSRIGRPLVSKFRMTKELLTVKSKPRGPINYWPYQDVDDVARRAVEKFQVTPFGQIHNCCAHIPYNSGKKDFYEKTGRESFEVFKYEFRVPGVDAEFMVMWDYNIGLVRMTPFFKCCKYGKTVPAKMLSLNPGLKDITHSITGGAILAQGYWMPYNCAKAVCATFCHDIAGALIPLFGPAFPSECIPPGAPEFQRMIISSQIIYDAQREAEITRRTILRALASGHRVSGGGGYTSSPDSRQDRRPLRPVRDVDRRLRVYTRLLSPYSTDTDAEGHHSGPESGPDSASSLGSSALGYAFHRPAAPTSMRHTSGWTAANHGYPPVQARPQQAPPAYHREEMGFQPPNPWLSAVPRFAPAPVTSAARAAPPRSQPPTQRTWPAKRRLDQYDSDDTDAGYEGGESQNGSPALRYIAEKRREENVPGVDPAEKNAALLLMDLSVRDQSFERRAADGECRDEGRVSDTDVDLHRAKRRRAASLPAITSL